MDVTSNSSSSNDQAPSMSSQGHQPSDIALFEKLKAYPFTADREFAKGLAIILQHPDVPASEDEVNRTDDLVLQAKCFYFSRKENLPKAIDFTAFKTWLQSGPQNESARNTPTDPHTSTTDTSADQASAPTPAPPTQEPSYPSSFAHIVELITTGQPIPGIQQIPDTVLEGHDTPSTKPRRRKPWEKETTEETCST
ncbi:hypothetical protein ATEIFO6365_0012001000 [Aspergillus terreus]|uniref:Uncharacterized protein n=1 Tax=Aspergillus terreus TaxID=33178 RepID=A0A5M3ZBN4_ASPTE|nr:hypothetical protein ATETN484_0013002000 [Aspergillus terreus]GFF20254.1 hypothetical protein ATEIFO6365_0012001000 [Aspergillus terreus]